MGYFINQKARWWNSGLFDWIYEIIQIEAVNASI
jgi:hypothetical protein